MSTRTHSVASKLLGGHAKSTVGIDDDLEPFSIPRSRRTHDSRIVVCCWTLLAGESAREHGPVGMLETQAHLSRPEITNMIVIVAT